MNDLTSPLTAGPDADSVAIRFLPETPDLVPQVNALVEQAFGPGRLAKTAERLRERNHLIPDLSLCAVDGTRVAGAVRLWPIRIGARDALFLGPIVVSPVDQHRGLGAELVHRVCAAARSQGHDLILLVGDPPFFGPLGFSVVPRDAVAMPGPVNPGRLMWRILADLDPAQISGAVRVP